MQAQWPLIVFTLFMCLSAGTFASLGWACIKGKGLKAQLPALGVSLAALIIGGLGSFLHLQHWERVFNGFGHITSGITQEIIACVIIGIAIVAYFIAIRRSETGMPHKAFGWIAIVTSIILVVTMSHSYMMASRPVWNNVLLVVYYLGSAAVMGTAAYALVSAITCKDNLKDALKIALYGAIAAIVTTLLFAIDIAMAGGQVFDVAYYIDPTAVTAGMNSSDQVSLFNVQGLLFYWLGGVIIGSVIPAALTFFAAKKEKRTVLFVSISLAAGLIGGVMFRVMLYAFGICVFPLY